MKNLFLMHFLWLAAAGCLLFTSCHKGMGGPSEGQEDATVTASIDGRVVDDNGIPVQGAAVTGGSATIMTDANGMFHFSDISLSSLHSVVKVVKGGYFMGARTLLTHEGGSNYVVITLISRQLTGNFSAAAGGKVDGPSGTSVQFPANSVVTASGNGSYEGTVHVYAAYLDPSGGNIGTIMPGDLRGIDHDKKELGLQTFGMMAVELEGDGGEKLQIAPGMKATITIPLPTSISSSAPATIPLWYFSDSTGLWMEEGTATRQGDTYVGDVPHFSYWNCDLPIDLVQFQVKMKDKKGNPLAYARVDFVSTHSGTRGGYTDANGFAQGLIPRGESFLFNVTGACGMIMYSENLATVNADRDLGTLTATYSQPELSLSGTAVDCEGAPVSNGYVNVFLDGLIYRAILHAGSWTIDIPRCSDAATDVKMTAVNNATAQQGEVTTVSLATGAHAVGQLTACGQTIEQYIHYTVNGKSYTLTSPPDTIQAYRVASSNSDSVAVIYGRTDSTIVPERLAGLVLDGITSTGTFRTSFFAARADNRSYSSQTGMVEVTITSLGDLYGYVEGTFVGTANVDNDGTTSVPVSGNFKVIRTF